MTTDRPRLILASASPRRLALLEQIGLSPDALVPTDLDETPRRGEAARALAQRLARDKLDSARTRPEAHDGYVVAADTVVSAGGHILPKAETVEQVDQCLTQLSGRTHQVLTGIAVASPAGTTRVRLVETRLRFKHLSDAEMRAYIQSREGVGKAGGYAIQGLAGAFVVRLIGSYTNVVGLPLYETASLLEGLGYPVRDGWQKAVR